MEFTAVKLLAMWSNKTHPAEIRSW